VNQPLTEQEIRLHAINLAVDACGQAQFHAGDKPGWFAELVLADAVLYAAWIADGTSPEPAAIHPEPAQNGPAVSEEAPNVPRHAQDAGPQPAEQS
jgi:hypothetical protein